MTRSTPKLSSTFIPRLMMLGLAVAVLVAAPASVAGAQVTGLYYREEVKDGRVYVFNTPERYKLWQSGGEMATSITLIGHGPAGETVIAENETALDLYNFKHGRPAYDRPTPKPEKAATPPPPVTIGGLWYLSYQDGKVAGSDLSKFTIKRGYINIEKKVFPFMSARITPDVHQDDSGDLKVRLKYAYAKFHSHDFGFLTRPELEVGVVHMPWLDFEEHINAYRMQDTMFMERNGLFNSADIGITGMALLGGTVAEDYQKNVSKAYPGRWGSVAVGVYDGGGYHASEKNTNKVIEGRLTIRPLPDILTGLQLSYFGVRGRGNTEAEPDWNVDALMLSFECKRLVFTGTWVDATGNQKGSAVGADGHALDRDGWSAFAEGRLSKHWSLIGRHDRFDPNTAAGEDVEKRTLAGVAYHMGGGNTVLVDYDRVEFAKPGRDADHRVQATLQVKF